MDYKEGKTKRVFVCRLHDGDDLLAEISNLCEREGVRAAYLHIVGGMRDGDVVVGPTDASMPPNPVFRRIDDIYEVTGMGTIFYQDNKPKIHIHCSFGRKDSVFTGCLRNFSKVFLVLEAVVVEITGVDIIREFDPVSGLYLLKV